MKGWVGGESTGERVESERKGEGRGEGRKLAGEEWVLESYVGEGECLEGGVEGGDGQYEGVFEVDAGAKKVFQRV